MWRPAALAVVLSAGLLMSTGATGPAGAAGTLTASDVAPAAGIATPAVNDLYGNPLVLDYDDDGVSDLLLSRHQVAGAQLFHGNADGSFTLVQTLPVVDRHSCDDGDFNGDGHLDFYCTIGADAGTSDTKANELWFQDPQSTGDPFHLVPGAWGATDPTGRGRVAAAFDANGDGLTDLFVGNAVGTLYPSPDRLYLNTGTQFVEKVSSVLNKSRGLCAAPADYDADGDMDLFACGTPNHLWRQNADGSYTDLGKSLGLSPEQPSRDADWVDLDNDGDLDLVQTSPKTLRIFYSDGAGGLSLGLARTLVAGRSASLADVDGDGDQDLYVVQSKSNTASNMPDILMMNSGDGRTFSDFVGLPRTTAGSGSAVETIDYLGQPAFVVTNGGAASVKGPRQLIVFQRP
jgi:hypothetical protein